MLRVKRFNEKHKSIAKVTTYVSLFIIFILSIIFGVADIICSIFAFLFGSWKRAVGIVLAVLLLVIAVNARGWFSGNTTGTERQSGEQITETKEVDQVAETKGTEQIVEKQDSEQIVQTQDTAPVEADTDAKAQAEVNAVETVEATADENVSGDDDSNSSSQADTADVLATDNSVEKIKDDTVPGSKSESNPATGNDSNLAEKPETTATPLVLATDKATVENELSSYMEEYPEMVGWLYFEDGHISYPIMQGSDNEKYRKLGYDGEEAWTGAIFLDSRSASDFSDSNSIVYGHNMKDRTMFGTLRDYREDPGYYDTHQYFFIITPEKTYKYLIFAYMDVPNHYVIYDYVGKASFDFVKDAEPVRIKSYMDSEIVVNKTKKVVTLSTCTDKDELRFVVLGVMVDD